ncbi:MAG: hypothetical protein AB7U63_00990 [Porticoccaceae bacterium]
MKKQLRGEPALQRAPLKWPQIQAQPACVVALSDKYHLGKL